MITLTRSYIRPRLITLVGRVDPKTNKHELRKSFLALNGALAWTMYSAKPDEDHISILRGHAGDIMRIAATLPHSSISRIEVEQMVLAANTREISALMQEAFNQELL